MGKSDYDRMTADEKLREIKRLFRLRMNGIVSAGMRERGAGYHLNFGLTRPMLTDIAARFTPDLLLAEKLWSERIREARLLAPLLYPVPDLTGDRATEWVRTIDYPELADQCCMSLFVRYPDALPLALCWARNNDGWYAYTGYQLMNRLLLTQREWSDNHTVWFERSRELLSVDRPLPLCSAVLSFLRRAIRYSESSGKEALTVFSGWQESREVREQSIWEELQDEYRYCWPVSE